MTVIIMSRPLWVYRLGEVEKVKQDKMEAVGLDVWKLK